ncbi:glycosyltransferase family 4 protein [Polynucleobacter paneuropaeus]|nr:glycosyltransferase family 4 protein [Polynucleobacter paneuropaeus]
MKIVVVLDDAITAGGGFSQALNAIIQIDRVSREKFSYSVLTPHQENIEILKNIGIQAETFSPSILDNIISILANNRVTQRLLKFLKLIGPFERLLVRMGCDLVYFINTSSRVASLQEINFIMTIMDDCHRDFPEFPEVRCYGEFSRREFINSFLPRAFLTIVDSEELAILLHQRYGVDPERILTMPFSPSPIITSSIQDDFQAILSIYKLKPGFFFYPAQFWPHKNHIRIIKAISLLRAQGENVRAVFVGADKGNLDHVSAEINKSGLQNQIFLLGFVPPSHLHALYASCCTVVMPTYFGPTNLPPLEAWQAKKPLIYSKHLASHCNDAALLVDPDDEHSLAKAMLKSKELDIQINLVEHGNKRISQLAQQRDGAEFELERRLKLFQKRRFLWCQSR